MHSLLENDDWQIAGNNWKIIDFGMNKKEENQEKKFKGIEARLNNISLWQNSFSRLSREFQNDKFRELKLSFDNLLSQCRNEISDLNDYLDTRFAQQEEGTRELVNSSSSALLKINDTLYNLEDRLEKLEERLTGMLITIPSTISTNSDKLDDLHRQQREIPSMEEFRSLTEIIDKIQTVQQQQTDQINRILEMLSENLAKSQKHVSDETTAGIELSLNGLTAHFPFVCHI